MSTHGVVRDSGDETKSPTRYPEDDPVCFYRHGESQPRVMAGRTYGEHPFLIDLRVGRSYVVECLACRRSWAEGAFADPACPGWSGE